MTIKMKKLFQLASDGDYDGADKEARAQSKDYGIQNLMRFMAVLHAKDLGTPKAEAILKKIPIESYDLPMAHYNLAEKYLKEEDGLELEPDTVEEHLRAAKKVWDKTAKSGGKSAISSERVMVRELAKKLRGDAKALVASIFVGPNWD